MNEVRRTILEALAEATRQVEAAKPQEKEWRRWIVEEWKEQSEHGPIYRPTEWFGGFSNAVRQRYLREIIAMEADGLVVRWCRWGGKFTNLKLTDEGRKLVEGVSV